MWQKYTILISKKNDFNHFFAILNKSKKEAALHMLFMPYPYSISSSKVYFVYILFN